MTFEEREEFKLQSRMRKLPKRNAQRKRPKIVPFETSTRRGVPGIGAPRKKPALPQLGSKEGTSLTNLFEMSSQIRKVKKGNYVEDYFEKIDQQKFVPEIDERGSKLRRRDTDNLDRYFDGERKK